MKTKIYIVLLFITYIGFYTNLQAQTTYYVKANASTNTGNSWANATTLQDALDRSSNQDQIWIAAGTYKPTNTNDRDAHFFMAANTNGVKIYGGFVGNETQLSQRNPNDNKTILSGDIGTTNLGTDNSYRILIIVSTLSRNTLIDGIIFEKAYNCTGSGLGGAVANYGSPTFANCTFRENQADWGAAIFNSNTAFPWINNCKFISNTAKQDAAGIYNYLNFQNAFNPNTNTEVGFVVENCLFSQNTSLGTTGGSSLFGGAAIFNDNASGTIRNSQFLGNQNTGAEAFGGAIFNITHNQYGGSNNKRKFDILVENCAFQENVTTASGGAIQNTQQTAGGLARLTLRNSQFKNNAPNHLGNTGTVSILPANLPESNLTMETGQAICTGELGTVKLLASQVAVNYQLFDKNTNQPISATVTGNGSALILNTEQALQNTTDAYLMATSTVSGVSLKVGSDFAFQVNPFPTALLSHPTQGLICQEEPTTFSGAGGIEYEFIVNGKIVQKGLQNTFTTTNLQNGDVVTLRTYSAGGCTQTSTPITIQKNILPTPQVSMICSTHHNQEAKEGEEVTFSAEATHLEAMTKNTTNQGTVQANNYQWYINNNLVATTTAPQYTTKRLKNGDEVTVEVSYDFACKKNWVIRTQPFKMMIHTVLETNPELNIVIFPNPTADYLYINSTNHAMDNLKITIVDLQGNVLIESTKNSHTDTFSLDVRQLKAGNYQMLVQSGKQIFQKRFLKF
ncbi:MAG: T9SS C-terminal target domain-containing protein [Cytophagales bacterium]|nr:MAG: T9SS C-terminal target domain-containing protein [Cytophagales bacterium]